MTAPARDIAGDDAGDAAPVIEVVVDEGVTRALVGVAAERIRLRICIEAVVPRAGRLRRTDEEAGELDRAITDFLVERAPAHAHLAPDEASLALQIDLLEAFHVPMGDKAISIWQARVWTPARAAVHGAAVHPMTLRRWRADLRRRSRLRPSGAPSAR